MGKGGKGGVGLGGQGRRWRCEVGLERVEKAVLGEVGKEEKAVLG